MTTVLKPNPAWRGDPTFIPELFEHFGIPLTVMPGAMDWGMGDFGAIQGIFWHHTGARTTSAAYIKNNPGLSNGLSSLFHIGPKGHHTLCGIGIAWHAGRGWGNGWPTNDANRVSLGWEIQSNGTDPWDEEQLYWVRRGSAVVLWYLGHDATIDHMTAHWEYSMAAQGKWDPGKGNGVSGAVMDMNPERAKVQAYINNIRKYGALDAPSQEEENGMSLTPKYFTDFIKGFFGPQFDLLAQVRDLLLDVQEQLRGRNLTGWAQLGKNAQGQNLTMVDALAALRQDVADLHKKIDEVSK